MKGYSFCIISDLRRPEKLAALVASIERLNVPAYEALVSVDVPRTARLGWLRNSVCARAKYDYLVVTDDDILFLDNFYTGLVKFGEKYDVLSCVLLNPDGTRHWDWMTYGGPTGHHLLDYDIIDDGHVYPPGGLVVMKRKVWEQVKWNDDIGFQDGAAEDVDFGERLHKAGYYIQFNPYSTAIHDDPRYTQHGDVVMRG